MRHQKAVNKAMQSDSANCHLFCDKPAKQPPACYAVDCGVKPLNQRLEYNSNFKRNLKENE